MYNFVNSGPLPVMNQFTNDRPDCETELADRAKFIEGVANSKSNTPPV